MSLSVKNMLLETKNSCYATINKDVNIQQVRMYVRYINRRYPIEIEIMLYNQYQVRVCLETCFTSHAE